MSLEGLPTHARARTYVLTFEGAVRLEWTDILGGNYQRESKSGKSVFETFCCPAGEGGADHTADLGRRVALRGRKP